MVVYEIEESQPTHPPNPPHYEKKRTNIESYLLWHPLSLVGQGTSVAVSPAFTTSLLAKLKLLQKQQESTCQVTRK